MDSLNELERSCKRARVDDEHELRGSNDCPICLTGFRRLAAGTKMPCNPNDAQVIQQCGHSYHQRCFIEFHNTCPEGELKCCLCRHEITKNLRLEATPVLDSIRVAVDIQHDEQEQVTIADHLRQEATVDRDDGEDGEDSEDDENSEDGEDHENTAADADYDPPTAVIPDPHSAVRRSSRNIATIPMDQEIEPAAEMELHEPAIDAPLTRDQKTANEILEKLRTYIEGRQPILILPELRSFMNRVSSTMESPDTILELIQNIQASAERLNSIVFYFIGHVLNNAKSHMSPQQYKKLWKQACSYLAQRRKIKEKTVYKYSQYAALVDAYPILFLADCKYGQLTQIPRLVQDVVMKEPAIQEYNTIHGQVLKAQLQNLLRQN